MNRPMELNWSHPGRVFRLCDRRQGARCWEVTLREGMPSDINGSIDGALLVDLWTDLVLPREIRDAWQPVIDGAVPSATPLRAAAPVTSPAIWSLRCQSMAVCQSLIS